jgi:hypothetical protein
MLIAGASAVDTSGGRVETPQWPGVQRSYPVPRIGHRGMRVAREPERPCHFRRDCRPGFRLSNSGLLRSSVPSWPGRTEDETRRTFLALSRKASGRTPLRIPEGLAAPELANASVLITSGEELRMIPTETRRKNPSTKKRSPRIVFETIQNTAADPRRHLQCRS